MAAQRAPHLGAVGVGDGQMRRERPLVVRQVSRGKRPPDPSLEIIQSGEIPADSIITTTPTNDGTGRAYGFDVFASRMQSSDTRVTGWA